MSTPPFLLYSPALEHPTPDEPVLFDELSRTMRHITRSLAARYRHACRPVHANSHAVLVGTAARNDRPRSTPTPLTQVPA